MGPLYVPRCNLKLCYYAVTINSLAPQLDAAHAVIPLDRESRCMDISVHEAL
jgi:hypothetical protein